MIVDDIVNLTAESVEAVIKNWENTEKENKAVTSNEATAFFITEDQFKQCFPKAPIGLYHAIVSQIGKAGCKTKAQQAMFLAQCGHEAGHFSKFSESFNYSVAGLRKVFPKYFSEVTAKQYGYIKTNGVITQKANQAGIANTVYANRMGNGNATSGDGYRYRGRGLIQITGKNNYRLFSYWANKTEYFSKPDSILASMDSIVATGIWFWINRGLANFSDITVVTKMINGGTNGLADRKAIYEKLMTL